MEQRTHAELDPELCGRVTALADGEANVELTTIPRMRADAHGLVHGGFVFGLADHAAMLAINHPNVVLGSSSIRFERPIVVGDVLVARARRREGEGKKQIVDVEVLRGETSVMRGEFVCFSPEQHVLLRKDES
jgi:acyl-coenzyme A thioesterase PaaI-like protein